MQHRGDRMTGNRFLLAAFWVLSVLILSSCAPNVSLNQQYAYTNITIPYGTPVSKDIGEYLDLEGLSDADKEYVRTHASVEYNGVPAKEGRHDADYDLPGEYELTILYDGKQYRHYNITVIDEEPPEFTRAEDVYIIAGYTEEEEIEGLIDGMFLAEDNSNRVTTEVTHDPIDPEVPGEYKVHAVATDFSGNRTEADAVFHLQAPAYGMKGTYVFVSITDQMATYFVDGEVALETPVVTGTAGLHDTPTGNFRILNKAMYVTLKGRGYKVKVTYWMAFLGSEFGLHSAEWRGVFGGDIYQYSGSHGCVNMPVYAAGELYDQIEIGTPVIVVP